MFKYILLYIAVKELDILLYLYFLNYVNQLYIYNTDNYIVYKL